MLCYIARAESQSSKTRIECRPKFWQLVSHLWALRGDLISPSGCQGLAISKPTRLVPPAVWIQNLSKSDHLNLNRYTKCPLQVWIQIPELKDFSYFLRGMTWQVSNSLTGIADIWPNWTADVLALEFPPLSVIYCGRPYFLIIICFTSLTIAYFLFFNWKDIYLKIINDMNFLWSLLPCSLEFLLKTFLQINCCLGTLGSSLGLTPQSLLLGVVGKLKQCNK